MGILSENQIKILNEIFKKLNTSKGNKSIYQKIKDKSKEIGSLSNKNLKLNTIESRTIFIKEELEKSHFFLQNKDIIFDEVIRKLKISKSSLSKTFNSIPSLSKIKDTLINEEFKKIQKINEKKNIIKVKIRDEKTKKAKEITSKFKKDFIKYKSQKTNTKIKLDILKVYNNIVNNYKLLINSINLEKNKIGTNEEIEKTIFNLLDNGYKELKIPVTYDYKKLETLPYNIKDTLMEISDDARNNPNFDMTEFISSYYFDIEWADSTKELKELKKKHINNLENLNQVLSRTKAGKIISFISKKRYEKLQENKVIEELSEEFFFEQQDTGYDPSEGQSDRRLIYVTAQSNENGIEYSYENMESITKGLCLSVNSKPLVNASKLSPVLNKKYNESIKNSVAIKKNINIIKSYDNEISKILKKIENIKDIKINKKIINKQIK